MKVWWRNLPLHLKLHLPIQLVLLVLLPIAHMLVMNKFESNMLEDVQLRTQDSATQSLLSLNAMMLADTIRNEDARAFFINKMSSQVGVEDFHLVRSSALQAQFGAGLKTEHEGDELDRLAAASKTIQLVIRQKEQTMRVVMPYLASKDFHGTNCLSCHHVPEGTILGTVSITIDLKHRYKKIEQLSVMLVAGQILLQLLLFILIGFVIRGVTRSVVDLEKTMHQIQESGSFSRRVRIRGKDEIGQIADVFNGFIAHIEDLHSRLGEKISALEAYHNRTEEELRIASDIMCRITDAHSMSDPAVEIMITPTVHYSGDLILVSRTPADKLHIMLADAVGHGLVAAVNLLPISQIFSAMTKKGFTISSIVDELNSKVHRLMPVDRFIGAALISIDFRSRVIEVWNGGVPTPLLLSLDGKILHEWKSQNLPLGILDDKTFSSEVETIRYDSDCQFFIFSDGLTEAESPAGEKFGEERITQLLQSTAPGTRFDALRSNLENHLCGHEALDDVSLAVVNISLSKVQEVHKHDLSPADADAASSHWRIAVSLGGDELRYMDPVPLLMQIVSSTHVAAEHHSALYVILSELFNNALEHGVLRLDSAIKQGPDGFDEYLSLRESKLKSLIVGAIDIEVENVMLEGQYGVKIRVVDSGNGFDYSKIRSDVLSQPGQAQHGRGIALARSLSYKLEFAQCGNEVIAYYICSSRVSAH